MCQCRKIFYTACEHIIYDPCTAPKNSKPTEEKSTTTATNGVNGTQVNKGEPNGSDSSSTATKEPELGMTATVTKTDSPSPGSGPSAMRVAFPPHLEFI
ncbi:hypothetical protein DV736_g984, partial [Chaetothyriales sp. CBS 134916]